MRNHSLQVATILASLVLLPGLAQQQVDMRVSATLSAAQKAVGGGAVRSFLIRGRRNGESERTSWPMEWRARWPDYYLDRRWTPAAGTYTGPAPLVERAYGFIGLTRLGAPAPDVAAALRYMARNHPDVAITYAILHDPGTAGQHVQIVGAHARRLIFGEYYLFDARGRFEGTAGLADGALGQQAAASNYNLHFGNYGGLPVKLAYCLFGLALTVVSATGVHIWLGKRRRRGHHEPRLRAAWNGLIWGAPGALALTLGARLLLGNSAPFTALFWSVLGLAIAAAMAAAHFAARRCSHAPTLQVQPAE